MSAIEICSFIFATLGFTIAVFALIEVKAMQRSTHKVQIFNPLTQDFETTTEEEKKALTKEVFDNL